MRIKGRAIVMAIAVISIFTGLKISVYAQEEGFEEPKENLISNINFINGGFEDPDIYDNDIPDDMIRRSTLPYGWAYVHQDYVEGWDAVPVYPENESSPLKDFMQLGREEWVFAPKEGYQFAELNASIPQKLSQVCNTVPGQKVYWEFYHRGISLEGEDVMTFLLNGEEQARAKTTRAGWKRYYDQYTVPEGQTETEFAFVAVSSHVNQLSEGNFLDAIRLFNPAFLELEQSITTPDQDQDGPYALIGDRVTYQVVITNTGEAETSRTVFVDNLPEGTEYVSGSLQMVYENDDGTTETLDTTGLIFYDQQTRQLRAEAGTEITGAEITDDDTGNAIPNTDANGTRSIARNDSVIITFDVTVTGVGITFGKAIKNQAKVFYNDLGFEKFNMDEQGIIQDEDNVSNVVSFILKDRVELEIQKNLDLISSEGQRFVFQIDHGRTADGKTIKTYYATVTVPAGQDQGSATLSGLRPGYYTVTELDSSWKYQINSSSQKSQTELLDQNTMFYIYEYQNDEQLKSWIDGNAEAVNQFVLIS